MRRVLLVAVATLALSPPGCATPRERPLLIPQIAGEPWTIARDPDLGPLTDPRQQPVDFGIWRAADGTWQLWSCIRNTRCGGKTRLFHRWEGKSLDSADWTPGGIAMQADPALGETPGGLQAPFALWVDRTCRLFYGDWENICLADGRDGKTFERRPVRDGKPALFTHGAGHNARDPMVLRVGDRFFCYYTAHPGGRGAVYARTSGDLILWTDARIVAAGGAAGTGPYAAECPFVIYRPESERFYLFRTQRYGSDAQTTVYASGDPLDFGVDDDRCRVGTLPIAAPEIVEHEGEQFVAYLLPNLKGIQIARLRWVRP